MPGVWGCLVLGLVSASLHQRVKAVPYTDVDHAFLAYSLEFDNCKGITDSSPTEIKIVADGACERAFLALDRIKLNTCQNWRDARCRLISGQRYRQCSCLVSNHDDSDFIATPFRECAKNMEESSKREAQSKKRRRSKNDDAPKSARKRRASLNSEAHGGAGTSFSPFSSGGEASQSLRVNPAEGITTRFPCNVCKRTYVYERTLREHMKSHDTDETKCPVCHRTYTVRMSLKSHMEKAHPWAPMPEKAGITRNSGPFICEKCGRQYTTWRILQSHRKTHNTFDTHCFQCKKTLSSRGNYKKHMQDNHPEDALAEEEAEKKRYIEEHPEVCRICNQRFKNTDGLRVHMRTHEGKTTCDVCGEVFPRTATLNTHKKAAHPILQ